MKKYFAILILLFYTFQLSFADEGMWIPLLLGKNIDDMQKKGLKLSAEDIYSINNSSLKDVVMIFGGDCSATLISSEGLIITSHQCSYSAVKLLSYCKECKNDYLKNGFWAELQARELSVPGLSVKFLVKMERVTDKILKDIPQDATEEERQKIIERKMSVVANNATQNTNYEAVIKPFYFGTEYYMFVQNVFEDIRLVGVPPLSVGAFGGTTDALKWPRHTADFALFRIYVDKKTNFSRGFDRHNVPYLPTDHAQISLKGVKENDFVMSLGFPNKTEIHETSYSLELLINKLNTHKANLRKTKLDIMRKAMDTSIVISQKYNLNYSIWDGFWKKAIYQNKGLQDYNAIAKKSKQQQDFMLWTQSNPNLKDEYFGLMDNFEQLYRKITAHRLALEYINELLASVDMLRYAKKLQALLEISTINVPINEKAFILGRATGQLREEGKMIMNDYDETVDKQILTAFLTLYRDSVDESFHPKFFKTIRKDFNNDIKTFVDSAYSQSMIAKPRKIGSFLVRFDPILSGELRDDPLFKIYKDFSLEEWKEIRPEYFEILEQINILNRKYISGLRQKDTENKIYPDANGTLRISYGKVKSYTGNDAVNYKFQTTLNGFIQKSVRTYLAENSDYILPEKFITLQREHNFGNYANEKNQIPVAFLTDLHTSAGNSGAPVFNAYGELIGLVIDRNAEGVMSDIIFNPQKCRTVVLDIRFILFIIEKYAEMPQIISEMTVF